MKLGTASNSDTDAVREIPRAEARILWIDDFYGVTMSAGGFEYGGSGYLFESATLRLAVDGTWSAEADGEEGGLLLSDLPCRGASSPAELVGRTWEVPDDTPAFSVSAFVGPASLPDGQLNMAGELDVTGGQVVCERYDAARGVLYVAFRLTIGAADGDVAEGLAHCRVQSAG